MNTAANRFALVVNVNNNHADIVSTHATEAEAEAAKSIAPAKRKDLWVLYEIMTVDVEFSPVKVNTRTYCNPKRMLVWGTPE